MANFHDAYTGVEDATPQKLDRLALCQAGVVTAIGDGYALRYTVAPRHGYEFSWIATRGCGNRGILVMRGTTPRTRELLRQGRIARLVREFDMTFVQAQRCDAARTLGPYTHEPQVIRTALATRRDPCWDSYPGSGNGVAGWKTRLNLGERLAGLSAPRLNAVALLVEALRK